MTLPIKYIIYKFNKLAKIYSLNMFVNHKNSLLTKNKQNIGTLKPFVLNKPN